MAADKTNSPGRIVTGMFTKNLAAKALAAICAVALWFYMKDKIQTPKELEFRVGARTQAVENLIIVPEIENLIVVPEAGSQTVTIEFTGPTEDVRDLAAAAIVGTISDRFFSEGLGADEDEAVVSVEIDDVDFPKIPAGIRKELTTGESIRFVASRKLTRELPVVARVRNETHPLADYTIGKPVASPNVVTVTGPKRWLEARTEIELEPIRIGASQTRDVEFVGRLPQSVRESGVTIQERVDVVVPIDPAEIVHEIRATVMILAPLSARFPSSAPLGDLVQIFHPSYDDGDGTIAVSLTGPRASLMLESNLEILQGPGVFYVELDREDVEAIREGRFEPDYRRLRTTEEIPDGIGFTGEPPELSISLAVPEEDE